MNMTFSDHLNNIVYKNVDPLTLDDEDLESFVPYTILKYISYNINTIDISEILQNLNLSKNKKSIYKILYDFYPQYEKINFKKGKKDVDFELVDKISKVTEWKIKDIVYFLKDKSKKEIKEIKKELQ